MVYLPDCEWLPQMNWVLVAQTLTSIGNSIRSRHSKYIFENNQHRLKERHVELVKWVFYLWHMSDRVIAKTLLKTTYLENGRTILKIELLVA
jgi:hypothetical protein